MAAKSRKSDAAPAAPAARRNTFREQAAATGKVILLSGGLLGGLWLLQTIAKN